MAFTHLLSPMKVGNKSRQKPYRKRTDGVQSGSSESNGSRSFLIVNWRDRQKEATPVLFLVRQMSTSVTQCVSLGFKPFDFAKPEEDMATFQAVRTYADRIKKHDCIALAELVHCGNEKVPFNDQQEAIESGRPRKLRRCSGFVQRRRMTWIVLQMISQWQLFICRKPDLTESSFMADMDLSLHSTFPH